MKKIMLIVVVFVVFTVTTVSVSAKKVVRKTVKEMVLYNTLDSLRKVLKPIKIAYVKNEDDVLVYEKNGVKFFYIEGYEEFLVIYDVYFLYISKYRVGKPIRYLFKEEKIPSSKFQRTVTEITATVRKGEGPPKYR